MTGSVVETWACNNSIDLHNTLIDFYIFLSFLVKSDTQIYKDLVLYNHQIDNNRRKSHSYNCMCSYCYQLLEYTKHRFDTCYSGTNQYLIRNIRY